MRKRVEEIDYLKSLLIILMVVFHLAYIGDKYPYLKAVVYTFHMSGFLVVSGFLSNPSKNLPTFLRTIFFLFVPYAIMEVGYVVMASVLPIREHITALTPLLIVEKIFISPIGPYWYIHTLILSYIVWYSSSKLLSYTPAKSRLLRLLFLLLCFYGLSRFGLIAFENAMYFAFGAMIRLSGISFTSVFQSSKLALLPMILLCCFPDNLDRGTFGGVIITYLSISFLLSTLPYLPLGLRKTSLFIGRNTLVILLFSPVFTFLSKGLIPTFSFDQTGILFACIATTITISGSLGIAWLMDKLRLSGFFFGEKRVLG